MQNRMLVVRASLVYYSDLGFETERRHDKHKYRLAIKYSETREIFNYKMNQIEMHQITLKSNI